MLPSETWGTNQDHEHLLPVPLRKWEHVFVDFLPEIKQVYRTFPSDPDRPEYGVSIFNFRMRCMLIYEKLVADKCLGGGGLPVDSLARDDEHPLITLFPLHNDSALEKFDKEWLKNWNW